MTARAALPVTLNETVTAILRHQRPYRGKTSTGWAKPTPDITIVIVRGLRALMPTVPIPRVLDFANGRCGEGLSHR